MPPVFKDFFRGDDKNYRISFGTVDVAGSSLLLTMKRSPKDADADAVLQQAAVMDAPDGQGQVFGGYITLDKAVTKTIEPGTYWIGVQFTNATGKVGTIAVERIKVKYDLGGSV